MNSVFCTADSRIHADLIAQRLKAAGISISDIAVLFPDRMGMPDYSREQASDGIGIGWGGLGIPESEAGHYEGRIKEGNVLISVRTDSPGEITKAKALFAGAGARDICTTSEASAKNEPATQREDFQPATAVGSFRL